MSDHTQNEVEVFNAARRLAGDERAAYLDQACAGNAAMRHRLEELLQVDEAAGDFLEKPVQPDATALAILGESVRSSLPLSEKPGDKIGPYKLLQQIGEGGCGVVYMAEQEAPVRRRVALKVVKLGMDTRQVIARFEAERQALALMDHPNIAKVLDAGATETGRPYFVMELVKGSKITEYCDQHRLSTRQRLDLFIQVCQAVQHAHQKGIIHRDLKPSNILVAERDGAADPQIIDFGIAKATDNQQLTDKTLFTAFEQFIGTPAYMSPEQASLGGQDIDTRSDIYSLGVLLYELLTGQPPFDSEQLRRSALDEILKIIRETEPPRPSTKLRALTILEQTTVAGRRQTEPAKLSGLLRGDLDWIVMKCLEKDRGRRYETANGLTADIRRYLNTEPVVARPPSRLYEFQKTVRRHKVGFAATAAVMVSLLIGLAVSTWMFVRERQEHAREDAARLEAEKAQANYAAGENLRLAAVLYDLRRYAEAERLLDRVPPGLVQTDPRHTSERFWLGWWHGLNEEWTMAATNFADAIRSENPTNWDATTLNQVIYASALLQLSDTSAYESFRRTVIARYHQTTNPVIAERICRISLTLPADTEVMRSLDPLYEVMKGGQGAAQSNPDPKPWASLGLALAEYRRSNYLQAIEWGTNSLKMRAPSDSPAYEATAHAVLALAHHALGQEAPARSELAESRRCIEEQPYSRSDTVWELINGLYAETILREAAVRIEGANTHDPGPSLRQFALGVLYADGRFVNKDSAKALACFLKADEEGLAKGQYRIGLMYARGEGTPTNLADAAVRHSQAAEKANNLDTLAAAHAEAGDFVKAVSVEKEAIGLLDTKVAIDDFTTRLKLYEANTPYREP